VKPITKRAGGVTQGKGPAFKPSTTKKRIHRWKAMYQVKSYETAICITLCQSNTDNFIWANLKHEVSKRKISVIPDDLLM
jgi:hypothetical protein